MFKFFARFIAALLLQTQFAFAEVDCTIVASLTRSYVSSIEYIGAESADDRERAMRRLIQGLRGLSADHVVYLLKREIGDSAAQNLGEFVRLAERVADISGAGRRQAIRETLTNARSQSILARAAKALQNSGCSEAGDVGQMSDLGAFGAANGGDAEFDSSLLPELAPETWSFIGISVVVSSWAGARAIRNLAARTRRRKHRHLINLKTNLHVDGKTTNVDLLDINCYGAKIKHHLTDPPESGAKQLVLLNGEWVAFDVAWSNQHYLGIRFQRRLSRLRVFKIVELAKYRRKIDLAPAE